MKRSYRLVASMGTVVVPTSQGQIHLPVFQGILKHPSRSELPLLLSRPEVAHKYTQAALQKAPWQILRQFPVEWLRRCLAETELPEGRRQALEFLTGSQSRGSALNSDDV